MSKIEQKHCGTKFSHCSCHCMTVSISVCLTEGATVTRGAGLTDRSIGASLGHVVGSVSTTIPPSFKSLRLTDWSAQSVLHRDC